MVISPWHTYNGALCKQIFMTTQLRHKSTHYGRNTITQIILGKKLIYMMHLSAQNQPTFCKTECITPKNRQ